MEKIRYTVTTGSRLLENNSLKKARAVSGDYCSFTHVRKTQYLLSVFGKKNYFFFSRCMKIMIFRTEQTQNVVLFGTRA